MWFMIYADISIPQWHTLVWGLRTLERFFIALRLCRAFLPHSHLNYLKGIEMPNWMLWSAQAGVWFPVGINLRKPSWCPQDQTTAEQRAQWDPFYSLFKKTRSTLVFQGQPGFQQERFFRERCPWDAFPAPLPKAPHGSSVPVAPASSSLSHSSVMVPAHTGEFLSSD